MRQSRKRFSDSVCGELTELQIKINFTDFIQYKFHNDSYIKTRKYNFDDKQRQCFNYLALDSLYLLKILSTFIFN